MHNVTVVIITKNAQKTLKETLESLKSFTEVVIYDNGSEDETIAIANAYENVVVKQGEFFGFGKTKAYAANFASNDWIFSLDADERITQPLLDELVQMTLEEGHVYEVQRDNYYHDKLIKCCGWYGERIVRLYNRKETNFDDAMVHENVMVKSLKTKHLMHPITHHSFYCVADFMGKIQKYSEIYAKDHCGKKDASIAKALFRGFFMFFKSYFLKGGIKSGFEGFVISFFAGLGTTVKYIKLREKNLYEKVEAGV